jgi:EAL domain-containing protein (putative c-di-GMP-specific phosphodiesterase class I)
MPVAVSLPNATPSSVMGPISLATALGVRVTGEGIETASQLSTLIELDCNHGQGFLLGRPAPPDELAALLRTANTTEVTDAVRLARRQ